MNLFLNHVLSIYPPQAAFTFYSQSHSQSTNCNSLFLKRVASSSVIISLLWNTEIRQMSLRKNVRFCLHYIHHLEENRLEFDEAFHFSIISSRQINTCFFTIHTAQVLILSRVYSSTHILNQPVTINYSIFFYALTHRPYIII